MRRTLLGGLLAASAAACLGLPAAASALDVDVTAAPYGAAGDGVTNDRAALQRAIDDVHAAGGGKVTLPAPKTFLSGDVSVKSGVTFEIARGATLKMSQNQAHWAHRPVLGHMIDGTIEWNIAMYRNYPLIHSGNARNVTVTGGGTIAMTRAATDETTIHAMGIGFHKVDGFTISNLTMVGASATNVSLYTVDNGIVSGMTMRDDLDTNVEGVGIGNSQHVRVTGNTMDATSDDTIVLWTQWNDPRGTTWWSTAVPEPVNDIEIDNNYATSTCCKAIALIPWGTAYGDQRQVEISDVRVHDNTLAATDAVGCWCDDPYVGEPPSAFTNQEQDQAPMKDLTFARNRYTGSTALTKAHIQNLSADFAKSSPPFIRNGGFERTGHAYWSRVGRANQSDAADYPVGQNGSWYGYLQYFDRGYTALYQGVSVTAGTTYTLRARVQTPLGGQARMYAYDTCSGTGTTQNVSSLAWTDVSLRFTAASTCGRVTVGFDSGAFTTGALRVDDVLLEGPRIDNDDPVISYEGLWYLYERAGDHGATERMATRVGTRSSATVTFRGTRARLLAIRGGDRGKADVYLDGVYKTTIDQYAATDQLQAVTYDTGTIAAGTHELRVVPTWTRNPASADYVVSLDAVEVAR